MARWLETDDMVKPNGRGAVAPKLDAETLAIAARDDETRLRGHRAPSLVSLILERATEPWVPLMLGDAEICRLRLGQVFTEAGGPGAGKSTLIAAIAAEHVRNTGPAVYVSRELDADELAARIVGMQCDASWVDVLSGRVPRADMERVLALPRLAILDGDDATLPQLAHEVEVLRSEYPDQPILAVVDYIQLLPADQQDARAHVSAVVESVRRLTKKLRIVTAAVSQTSRASGVALAAGDSVGIETMTAGAESSAIERAAYLTLAIGARSPERDDGTCTVDLHIGKYRMGRGDRVLPMTVNPRTGRWRIEGESRPAAEVKAEKKSKNDDAKVRVLVAAIPTVLRKATEPTTRRALRTGLNGRDEHVRAAVEVCLDDEASGVVEVGPKKGGAYQVWHREPATARGVSWVPRARKVEADA